MKRIIILCLICAMLLACVPTPEEEYVANKGDNRLDAAIAESGEGFSVEAYRKTLPEIWNESYDSADGSVHVHLNASIYFPKGETLPTVEVAPRGNDLEAIRWLGEHMAQDGYFGTVPVVAEGWKIETKEDIALQIEQNRDLYTNFEILHPEFNEQEVASFREELEKEYGGLLEKYQGAPEFFSERIDDLSSLEKRNLAEIGLFSKSGHRIADVSLVFDPNHPQKEQLTIWGSGLDPECCVYWQEPINDVETAIRCGDRILKEIGYDDHYTVADTKIGTTGIGVIYAPQYRGVGYSLGETEDLFLSYEEYYPEDKLELVFAKGTGILKFVQWNGNSRFVRETSENIALLSFEEIQRKIKNDLSYLFSWTNENIKTRSIEITEIRLEYKRVPVVNDQKRLLVPAWTVVGKVIDRGSSPDVENGGYEPFETETVSGMILTVNAVDGTLIESATTG